MSCEAVNLLKPDTGVAAAQHKETARDEDHHRVCPRVVILYLTSLVKGYCSGEKHAFIFRTSLKILLEIPFSSVRNLDTFDVIIYFSLSYVFVT